jgi:hypothetical protein
MAEPLYMWSSKQLMEFRVKLQEKMEEFWKDRNKTIQSPEEICIEDVAYRIDDELRERTISCDCCGTTRMLNESRR